MMSQSVFSQMNSESMKIFTDRTEQEKQTVLALLQIPQNVNTKNSNSQKLLNSGRTSKDENLEIFNSLKISPKPTYSGSESHVLIDAKSLSNDSLNNGFVSIDQPSQEIERKDSTNSETPRISIDTVNMDEQDKVHEMSNKECRADSPYSPVASHPQEVSSSPILSSRVSSACSEEIVEAFQGQFTDSLRTKNDGSARRPMNAYMLFCKINRTQVKEKNSGFSNREISQILGKMWHDLDKEEWQKYTNMAFELRKAHYVAYPDFKWSKKQKRPASYPSKRTQLEDGDVSNIRPRSTIYPDMEFIDRNVVPYAYKPLSLGYKKELSLPHPSALHSVNPSQISALSPFRIDSLANRPDHHSPDDSSKINLSETDDGIPVKKRKVLTPIAGQFSLVSSEELLQHYLIPNLVAPIPAIFRTPVSNIQALANTSLQNEQLQANQLRLAIPMYHAGAAASLMSQGFQLFPTDVNTNYLALQHGLLQTAKLATDP